VKRFWHTVSIDSGAILLDERPVRTPGRAPLVLPTPALAEAIAEEWRAVGEVIDPRAMPLTGLANAAIDVIAPDPARFAAGLAAYAESDLLCYRAEAPVELVARQAAAWDPLLDWARARYDVRFEIAGGIVFRPQPPETIARMGAVVAALAPFVLAALSPVVTITGSLVAALALIEGAASPEAVWAAARVDEAWQAEQWGEDDLAIAATTARRREFDAATQLLALYGCPISSACE